MKTRLLTAFAILVSFVAGAHVARAGRPLAVDDFEPSAPGEVWLEFGIEPELTRDGSAVELPVCLTFGAISDLEISVFCGVEHEKSADEAGSEFGVSEIGLETKWKLLDQDRAGVSGAMVTYVAVPIGERPDPGFDAGLMGILTHDFGNTAMDLNAGLALTGLQTREPIGRMLSLGMAVRHDATESLALVGDVMAEEQEGSVGGRADAGIRYTFSDRLVVDAAVGAGFGDSSSLLVMLGFTCSL